MNKFLIVGLGNIGAEYHNTRHNIGFRILDAFCEASNISFDDRRYGYIAHAKVKNAQLTLLKPSTYMNLSGMAVRYWLKQENIELENMLVIVDDIALPCGTLRLRGQGSDGGHNGLKNIAELLCTQQYARLRFGIGNEFSKGAQVNYVLSNFSEDEEKILNEQIPICVSLIKDFCLQGLARTMNIYNTKGKK